MTVTTFRDEAEAIAMANGVEYGLGGGLWTRDLSRAHRVAAALQTGMVWINSHKRGLRGRRYGSLSMAKKM